MLVAFKASITFAIKHQSDIHTISSSHLILTNSHFFFFLSSETFHCYCNRTKACRVCYIWLWKYREFLTNTFLSHMQDFLLKKIFFRCKQRYLLCYVISQMLILWKHIIGFKHSLSGQIKLSKGMSTHMNGEYVCKETLRTNTLEMAQAKCN